MQDTLRNDAIGINESVEIDEYQSVPVIATADGAAAAIAQNWVWISVQIAPEDKVTSKWKSVKHITQ